MSDWVALGVKVNRHDLLVTMHAPNENRDWMMVVKQFRLSHKSRGLALFEKVTVQ